MNTFTLSRKSRKAKRKVTERGFRALQELELALRTLRDTLPLLRAEYEAASKDGCVKDLNRIQANLENIDLLANPRGTLSVEELLRMFNYLPEDA